jgi:uncharacterized protein involved in outer membrane biogenesis
MTSPVRRRLALGALALGAVAAVAAGFAIWKLPGDDEVAARVIREFDERTGIGLRIGRLHWSLWPRPNVVVEDVATVQDEPIRVRRASAVMPWGAVFARELRLEAVEADGIALPRGSVRAFRGKGGAGVSEATGAWKVADTPVPRARFTDLTWIDRRGIALRYDGEAEFDPHWRPRTAEVRRREVEPPARARIEREDPRTDRWRVIVELANGTWNGDAALQTAPEGRMTLTGQLQPQRIDLELLLQTFGRGAPVAGTLRGDTTFDATGDTVPALWRGLRTRTRFDVRPATLTRFDLARAVKSAGTTRGGRTPLDQLTGTLDTRTTDDGVELNYRDLKARSGILTATGNARILNRRLEGEAAVDIVDGVVGVPLKLGGTLDSPELSLTGAALAGAAVGTAVLPGVGTAIGARIGQQIERLFGGGKDKDGKDGKNGTRGEARPPIRGPRAP